MAHNSRAVVLCVLANLFIGEMSGAETRKSAERERLDPPVRLLVVNMARLPSTVLTDAEREAADVYRAAGVTLLWSDALADTGSIRTTHSEPVVELRVVVVGGAAERRFIEDGHLADTILGFALTKGGCFCGRNAYIFSDRIMTIGYGRGNPTSLLGRVLAHEVGHLLLSRDSHSPTGIMRATLNTELSVQPRFSKDDVTALRRGLALLGSARMALLNGVPRQP